MIATLEHPDNSHFGLKDVTLQLSQYFEEITVRLEKKKLVQRKIKIENEQRMLIDDLMYNYSTQKTFFDFFDSFIKQEGQKMISSSTKEEAMYFCDQMEAYVKKIEDIQMNYEPQDFESLDAFFAFNSAYALMNSIIHLYHEMCKVSEKDSQEYLIFIEKQIQNSLKESRTKVDSVSEFLKAI